MGWLGELDKAQGGGAQKLSWSEAWVVCSACLHARSEILPDSFKFLCLAFVGYQSRHTGNG